MVTPEEHVKTVGEFSVWIKPFSDLTPGHKAPKNRKMHKGKHLKHYVKYINKGVIQQGRIHKDMT